MRATVEILTQDVGVVYLDDDETQDQLHVVWLRGPNEKRGVEIKLLDRNNEEKAVLRRAKF